MNMKTITELPEGVLAQHIAVLGKTRSGKSSTIRLLVEGLLDQKKPVCVVDPKGDWWGLKSSADGKHAGYPIVIFGGEHADVPLNPHAGASIAELVATGNRPCIIDLGGWMVGDRTRFFVDFASHLFKLTRGARWLVVDEVHNFAPQGKVLDPDAGKMLHWANRLASEGSGKGLTIIAASQRPQKVHKDFLTCAETLIAMRVIHPLDRGAIKDWLDGCPDPERSRDILASLAGMKRGDGWVWSPEIGYGPEQVHFAKFKTYDSFKAQAGETVARLKGWADVDLDDVRKKLAKVVEEAKANDPRELKRQVADLQRQLVEAAKVKPGKTEIKRVEVPILKDQQVKRIEAVCERLNGALTATVDRFVKSAESVQAAAHELSATIGVATKVNSQTVTISAGAVSLPVSTITRPPAAPVRKPKNIELPKDDHSELSRMERALLVALAQHPKGLTKQQICIFAGYQPSGPVSVAYARFYAHGWMQPIGGGLWGIQHSGLEILGSFEPLPTGAALRDRVLSDSRMPDMERKLLAALFESYPNPLSKTEVCERAGYKPSGPVSVAFGKFNRIGWMVKSGGGFVAGSEFFE